MTAVAPFRLFGRAPDPAPPEQAPDPAPGRVARRPPAPPPGYPAWGAAAWPAGPPPARVGPIVADPPTDPGGIPAVPVPRPVAGRGPAPSPDPAEAAALAGAFAVDYLSWDEEDPARRGRVLSGYLALPGGDPAHLGWDGTGRQRADFALPGRVRADGEGRVLVDVRVRVTPYRAAEGAHRRPGARDRERAQLGVPAVAPSPQSRRWEGLPARWVRLSVPVVWENGRLAVDTWEETIGAEPPQRPDEPAGAEHALADDDPLGERPGGAR